MYVMKSQDEIKRILETEGLKYTIRELSRRHNIELKRFSRLFPELTRQVIEKRKSIMRNKSRISVSRELKEEAILRKCLSCDSEFKASNKFKRLCDSCKNKEYWV